jgi:hypothetical protein
MSAVLRHDLLAPATVRRILTRHLESLACDQ